MDSRRIAPRGVRANAGVTASYQARVMSSVKRMHRELVAGLRELWLEGAADAPLDLERIERLIADMRRRWGSRWDGMAEAVAEWFGSRAKATAKAQFVSILREVGFAVKVSPSASAAALMEQILKDNVALIKSVHSEHLDRVLAAARESFYAGRDLGGLEAELSKGYGITERRARMIAKDQNNKASQGLSRIQAREAGISKGVWQHMLASYKPRPTHEQMDGQEYELAVGLFDPEVGRMIQPGELINCNCECRWVIPGEEDAGFSY
jgi:uncharacterized protein with gpF-like domain